VAEAVPESPNRVLLLAGVFEVRGSTATTLRLAERLPEQGFEPLVVCSDAERLSSEVRRELSIRQYHGLSKRLIGWLARRRLTADFADQPPDLIHVQSSQVVSLGARLADEWGVPLVVSVHEVLQSQDRIELPRSVRKILAVSEAVGESLVDRMGVSADRVVVVPGGVDVPDVQRLVGVLEPDHVPSVGTAGPLEAVKGLPYFLNAAQKVLAAGRDAEFLVAGAGPEENNLRRLAGDLGIRDRVTFLPNRPDFSDALAAMDVFCLPSLQQGLGTIMLEAMSLARPVIASAVGGVCSVLRDGETGMVVPPEDSAALAGRMLSLLDDPVAARTIGEAGRRDVLARFGTVTMVERTVSVYKEVIRTGEVLKQPGTGGEE